MHTEHVRYCVCMLELNSLKYFRTKETCCQCEKLMDEEAPIKLQCKHTVCEQCLIDLMDGQMKCPECNKKIPRNFDSNKTKGKMRCVFLYVLLPIHMALLFFEIQRSK